MTTRNTNASTFTASGVSFKRDEVKASIKRANVLFNFDRTPMSLEQIKDALANNKLQPSQLIHVVLGYDVDGVVQGVKLPSRMVRLAGQRKDGKLVGCAPEAHKYVINQLQMLDTDRVEGSVTVGKKSGDLYFGYTAEGVDYKPAIASVSSTFEGDAELYTEVTDLMNANPDRQLLVFYVPSVDFKAWVACNKAMLASKA